MASSGHHHLMSSRVRMLAAALTVLALGATACSSSDSSSSNDAGPTTTPTTSTATRASSAPSDSQSPAQPYLPVPKGVHLTAPGSRLKFGQHAVVAWRPTQKTIGVLKVTVKGAEQVRIKEFKDWQLPAATQQSTPYYVHVQVKNLGRSNLSGVPIPLYVLDKRGVLLESSRFQSTFKPCPSGPLPAHFKHGHKTRACLVYFAPKHGRLVAVSFRPTQKFVSIDWRGHVAQPSHHQKKKSKKQ